MLDILNTLLGIISANFIFQPIMFASNPLNAGSGLFKVVLYKTNLSCHDLASVTVGSKCFIGSEEIDCALLDLGERTMNLLPWLRASHQIFCGLVFFTSVLVILFHHNAKKGWPTKTELKGYRAFIMTTEILCCLSGLFAVCCGLGMMMAPAIDIGVNSVVDVTMGWAQVFMIAMLVGSVFLTMGFYNESKQIIADYDDDEEERYLAFDDEVEPLLAEKSKQDCFPAAEGQLIDV